MCFITCVNTPLRYLLIFVSGGEYKFEFVSWLDLCSNLRVEHNIRAADDFLIFYVTKSFSVYYTLSFHFEISLIEYVLHIYICKICYNIFLNTTELQKCMLLEDVNYQIFNWVTEDPVIKSK